MEDKTSLSGLEFRLHPLVLINLSDHYTRIKANSTAGTHVRVMGCLLGSQSGRTVDISNSFEMRFDAEGLNLDQAFLTKKQEQYKQVFPKLDVVGWYATGSELQDADMHMHRKVSEINESPVFLLLNPMVDCLRKDLPVTLYETEFHVMDGAPSMVFVRANYTVETSDAERIGVDQVAKILPSGKASGSEQLSAHLISMHSAIKMLNERIRAINELVSKVQSGEVAYPHALLRQISSLVHSLPAMNTAAFNKDYLTEYNNTLLTIYLSTITKGVYTMNEIVDKFMIAYDKSARRRGMM